MEKSYIMSIDAGGTMTDTFFVDQDGRFVVGKAQTTPDDESRGFSQSSVDALKQWNTSPENVFPQVQTGIYSGTSMLNRLLERKGQKLGIIVTAGQEDYFRLERGIQTYLGYSYQDRLKVVTHRHNTPLVPRARIHGVRGRIDVFGDEAIPLYEDEVRIAARKLIGEEVKGIVVNLLFSYANDGHEQRVKGIIEEEAQKAGQWFRETQLAENDNLIQLLKGKGMKVTSPDRAAFKAQMQYAYDAIGEYAGKDNVAKFLKMVEETD